MQSSWPSANELDLMVPMARQVGSAFPIPKEKKKGGMDGWMDGWMNLGTNG
jgi:hypothetical protein